MVKLLIELLDFLRSCAPLLTSLAFLTLFFTVFSKSIRKHSTVYYILFAIPFVLVALPSVGKLFGIEISGFVRIPFLGEIIRDYIHMGTFGHPLLIIIMYIGALNPRITGVKRLMSIRKEMSIISGFAVFAHSLIRIMNNLPGSFKFFTDNSGYLSETKVASELGAGISSFSFILGIIMLAIFIPLWVTSFDGVRKRMGYKKWKKLQRWSYVLYATLFFHAMGIQIGGMLNPRGGNATRPAVETTTVAQVQNTGNQTETARPVTAGLERRDAEKAAPDAGGRNNRNGSVKNTESGNQNVQTVKPASGGRIPSKGFADIKVSAQTKRYINILSLLFIYGSYLFLRLRKAKKDAGK